MKYELRATGRVMLPGFAAVLILAGMTRLSADLLYGRGDKLEAIAFIVSTLFVLSCCAIGLLTLLLMIQRFRDNLLRDEGYLMHTLPVTTAQNIFAKMLTSIIWNFGTSVTIVLSIAVLTFNARVFSGIRELLSKLVQVPADIAANGVLYGLEVILCVTAGLSAFALLVYASMALGSRFSSHRGLMSVLIFFGFQIVTNVVMGIAAGTAERLFDHVRLPEISGQAGIHLVLLGVTVGFIVYGAIFYAITAVNLKKHLNLE